MTPTPKRLQTDIDAKKSVIGVHHQTSKHRLGTKTESLTPPKQHRATTLLTIALLLGSASLVTGGLWLSFEAIFQPDALVRLNQMLPEWMRLPTTYQEPPQTLTQVRQQLSKAGKVAGVPVPLEADGTSPPKSLILPVLSSSPECETDCEQQIIELRVYQIVRGIGSSQVDPDYQLVDQLPIQGPEESFAIAPLLNAESGYRGSNQPLPVTELHRFEGNTPKGVWLYLQGQTVQRGQAIAYGYVLHYNPDHSHLSLMLPWTSPTAQVPQWQKVNTNSPLELVIDQTIDLEPQLSVYQVKPAKFFLNPIQLERVSLAEPALNSPDYQDAIAIAQSGLWSPAWKWLQYIKQQQKRHWTTAAQAQMDLIELCAKRTQAQAEQAWANPSQQVMADLIDGRWAKGLQVFQASPENTREIGRLLQTDSGRLWHRVEVALRVNPQPEVQAWGVLIVAAQQGQKEAISWLEQQPEITPATIADIKPLLQRLDGNFSTISNLSQNNSSRILGTVRPLAQVNPSEWFLANQDATLELEHQYWYQVQVDTLNLGDGWQRAPFSDLEIPTTSVDGKKIAPSLWHQLCLDTNPQIQIVVWLSDGQQVTTTATVKAVQLHSGTLELLASATEPITTTRSSLLPLALTESALQWVQPTHSTIAELSQQQPETVAVILPVLWRELQKSDRNRLGSIPSLEQMQEQLGNWSVDLVDLTGDGKSGIVLTVSPEAIANAFNSDNASSPSRFSNRTIIFSDTGSLMYSDFNIASHQSVAAIADLQDGDRKALLVKVNNTYSLQRWSAQRRRFQ